jgi:hypothetical protein
MKENSNSHITPPANSNMNGQVPLDGDNTIKDPNEWTTGDEPITGAQRS